MLGIVLDAGVWMHKVTGLAHPRGLFLVSCLSTVFLVVLTHVFYTSVGESVDGFHLRHPYCGTCLLNTFVYLSNCFNIWPNCSMSQVDVNQPLIQHG